MTVIAGRLGALGAAATLLLAPACGGNGRSAKDFCQSLRNGTDPVAIFAADGGTPTQMGAGITRLQDLESKAPSPVSDALTQLIEVGTDIRGVLITRAGASSGSTPATVPSGDADKAAKASATIQQYASVNCGVELGSSGATSPTSAPAPSSSS